MNFRLNGKTALVTGAARGIGAGIATAFHAAGAKLVLVDLASSRAQLEALADTLGDATVFGADLTVEHEVKEVFAALDSAGVALDILVNNAGAARAETIFEMTLDSWNDILAANLTSAFLCSRSAMERMRHRPGGRIIQLGSVVGHQGALKGHLHYGVSKSGIHGFTRTLARTAAPLGITVNAIAPGLVETDMLFSTHGTEGVKALEAQVPLGRLASVADIGAAAVYLASDEASYLTGVILDVNGGLYLR
ncbi:SDR family NAD(P)-dependent oxidoreductase [Mesorhizobium sp. YR577]|uniref:SDR family NAD(P)-dependent oxidoreductase n=1 Tax=Mesorhizobium sp. YR577 TaxID=1884373 RepID=UPI0008E2E5CF|nr:SDR family NAD(P)-dependent oxidoreductase [Mesorhizobium sp. YR577]SFU16444.1 3-oxoacyl-[acyl-carrier protein] reductase [Mesorhizobium sp. YR577]